MAERRSPLDILYRLNPEEWKKLFGEHEEQRVVSQGIIPLAKREYEVMTLRYRLGYTQSAAGSEMGVSVHTIASTENRVRGKIIDYLQRSQTH